MGTHEHDELRANVENGTYAKLIRMQEQAHEAALVNARRSSAIFAYILSAVLSVY